MIFTLYPRLKLKVRSDDDQAEEHIFDRSRLMFTEVAEIEKVTGLSYPEWERELARFSITAVAALIHVLRKRAGTQSDFATMQFNAARLDVVPLHDDDTEYTPKEVADDVTKLIQGAQEKADPTLAADGAAATVPPEAATSSTSPASPNGSTSSPGNGSTSPGPSSAASRPELTSA